MNVWLLLANLSLGHPNDAPMTKVMGVFSTEELCQARRSQLLLTSSNGHVTLTCQSQTADQ